MSHNPYGAPGSEVRDPDQTEEPVKPAQVRWACRLLWLALVLSMALLLPRIGELWLDYQDFGESLALMAVTIWIAVNVVVNGIYALLVWLISRRKNWARWGLLVYGVSNLWMVVVMLKAPSYDDPVSAYIAWGLTLAAEFWALWLLFFGTGARWFKRTPVVVER